MANKIRKGRKQTQETKDKISKALIGRKKPPRTKEHSRNLGNSLRGRKLSKECREKVIKNLNPLAFLGGKQSEEFKKMRSEAWKGNNNPNVKNKKYGSDSSRWEGGKTQSSRLIRSLKKYNNWKIKVFERDNFTCQKCNKRGVYLEAHHKKPFYKILIDNKIETVREALKCKELWDVDNGGTLCKKCHNITKGGRRK